MTTRKIIRPLAVLCAAALAVMLVVLLRGGQDDFTPPPLDPAAVQGTPTVPESAGYSGLDAQAYRVSVAGVLTVDNGAVDVWLTNPADSAVWLKVRLLDEQGAVLGESGLLRPGEYVRSVALTTIPRETGPVVMKLMAYEPETYYSAGSVLLQTQLYVT